MTDNKNSRPKANKMKLYRKIPQNRRRLYICLYNIGTCIETAVSLLYITIYLYLILYKVK